MQVEDVSRKLPPQHPEAGQFRLKAVADNERILANIKRRGGAEFALPLPDGAEVLKVFVQHIGDHAQRAWEIPGGEAVVAAADLVLEVDDDDRA